jgi:glycosyltransferase involved in cell wall biosynthesis
MKILCLSKRRPQDRDLLTRPYGRFFYLPRHLALLGHQVTLLLLSYNGDPSEHMYQYNMEWYSESIFPVVGNGGAVRYLKRARQLIESDKPDWIIGFSDTWYSILSEYLGFQYQIKILIDAYDNYESYIPWAKPLHWKWRQACKKATVVTAAGPGLLDLLEKDRANKQSAIIPMAADPVFQPMDQLSERSRLNLPAHVQLVGYCGSLHRHRDVETLFEVIRTLQKKLPEARFVLSGRRQSGIKIPADIKNYIIELGYLPDQQMPSLINAVNVLLSVNRASSFGNYSYPVKLYEAMQCKTPVLATDLAGSRWILRGHPECLVPERDVQGIVSKISDLLSSNSKSYSTLETWENSALLLNQVLL